MFRRESVEPQFARGVLAATIVKEFARSAVEEDWDGVDEAARQADQPILSGLRYILAHGVHDRARAVGAIEGAPPAWVLASHFAGARQI